MRQRFLIVCEGTQTEPAYFKAFQVPRVVIDVHGVGKDPLAIVQTAKNHVDRSHETYDQVWCVFDRDDVSPERIHQAIAKAKGDGYKVALSNQSFELWYILHFQFLHTAMLRQDYVRILNRLLDHPYAKNDPDMYDKLKTHQATAIENAKRLYQQHTPWNPVTSDPSTTVYLLVEELNKHTRQ